MVSQTGQYVTYVPPLIQAEAKQTHWGRQTDLKASGSCDNCTISQPRLTSDPHYIKEPEGLWKRDGGRAGVEGEGRGEGVREL